MERKAGRTSGGGPSRKEGWGEKQEGGVGTRQREAPGLVFLEKERLSRESGEGASPPLQKKEGGGKGQEEGQEQLSSAGNANYFALRRDLHASCKAPPPPRLASRPEGPPRSWEAPQASPGRDPAGRRASPAGGPQQPAGAGGVLNPHTNEQSPIHGMQSAHKTLRSMEKPFSTEPVLGSQMVGGLCSKLLKEAKVCFFAPGPESLLSHSSGTRKRKKKKKKRFLQFRENVRKSPEDC